MHTLLKAFFALSLLISAIALADELKVGDAAPLFTLKNQDGADFSLINRRGKGWTILYFYPKSGTPGCTKEACAFRDAIDKIKALGAEVYGISSDSVEEQKAFHSEHKLGFDLLADTDMQAIREYDAKMPVLGMAKRWTFMIDGELIIRSIQKDVDPSMEAARIADELLGFQHADLK